MKIELLLNDDIELRAYIKELIKNEVINISRTEISETVKDVLNKKLENTYNTKTIDDLIEQEIKRQVNIQLRSVWSSRDSNYLENYIDTKIKSILSNYFTKLGLKTIQELDV